MSKFNEEITNAPLETHDELVVQPNDEQQNKHIWNIDEGGILHQNVILWILKVLFQKNDFVVQKDVSS